MKTADYGMFIYMGICSLTMIVIGIVGMIKTKKKDEFVDCFLMILVGFTPGAMLLVTIGLGIGLMFLLVEMPTQMFKLFKGKEIEE